MRYASAETTCPVAPTDARLIEKVPVDGAVREGSSVLDEFMLNSEPLPVTQGQGDKLIGATLDTSAMVLVRSLGGGGL